MFYQAFSVHQKHKKREKRAFVDAEEIMTSVSSYLQGTVDSVRMILNTTKKTNGPEGTIASKTVESVKMIKEGFTRIGRNVSQINTDVKIKPESLLTLQVDNFHFAVIYIKHPACLHLQYARDFWSTVLESAKGMSTWSAYHYTHSDSYYPVAVTDSSE
jgi:glycine cleavage system H lipoate-binding protein